MSQKTKPLLFLQHLWLLLTDFNNFFSVTIRNDLHTYLEQKLHYHVECMKVQFCEDSFSLNYFLLTRKVSM